MVAGRLQVFSFYMVFYHAPLQESFPEVVYCFHSFHKIGNGRMAGHTSVLTSLPVELFHKKFVLRTLCFSTNRATRNKLTLIVRVTLESRRVAFSTALNLRTYEIQRDQLCKKANHGPAFCTVPEHQEKKCSQSSQRYQCICLKSISLRQFKET